PSKAGPTMLPTGRSKPNFGEATRKLSKSVASGTASPSTDSARVVVWSVIVATIAWSSVLVNDVPLVGLSHSLLANGKTNVLPCGTVIVRLAWPRTTPGAGLSSENVPHRKKTLPGGWPFEARSPVGSRTGLSSAGIDKSHCQNIALHS